MATLLTAIIEGPPRVRGRAYGEALRAAIRARDALWQDGLRARWGVADPVAHFLGATNYGGAIAAHAPDLMEEVRGIAEGAGLPVASILACQLMDEEWCFERRGAAHCSALGAVAGGRGVLAQNMDLIDWMDGFQTVLTIRGDGPDQIVLTVAGMIGLCGVNAEGLGLTVNTLATLADRSDGLPVAFAARLVLAQPDLAGALSVLDTVPHASGQNYIVADGTGIAGRECSAAGAVPWENEASLPHLRFHTNHPLRSRDLLPGEGRDEAAGSQDGSRLRQARLAAHVASSGALDRAAVEAALADTVNAPDSICRRLADARAHGRSGFTFASAIWSVGPSPSALVAGGPPDEVPYQAFSF